MKSFFDDDNLAAIWDDQLRIQVESTGEKESRCLESHGLKKAKTILDVGMGNGYFLSRLAKKYPKKTFVGIEVSPIFFELAKKNFKKMKLKNVSAILGRCPIKLGRKYDLILFRLSFYCMKQRDAVLKWAHQHLSERGRVVIADIDLSSSWAWPVAKPWTDYQKMTMQVVSRGNGGDLTIGTKLPSFLMRAGFQKIVFEQKHWWSSVEMKPDDFLAFWTADAKSIFHVAAQTLGKKRASKDKLKRILRYFHKVARSKINTVFCPLYIASGSK